MLTLSWNAPTSIDSICTSDTHNRRDLPRRPFFKVTLFYTHYLLAATFTSLLRLYTQQWEPQVNSMNFLKRFNAFTFYLLLSCRKHAYRATLNELCKSWWSADHKRCLFVLLNWSEGNASFFSSFLLNEILNMSSAALNR